MRAHYRKYPIEWTRVLTVTIGALVFVVATGAWAFAVRCPGEDCSFARFINGQQLSLKSMIVGFGSGCAFGFADNALLYMGMDSLDSLFRRLPRGDEELVRAGYGNTFSNGVSAFTATFTGAALSKMTGIQQTPLWSDALGVVLGGLFGLLVPRLLMGRKKSKK